MVIQGILPWCFTPETVRGQAGLHRGGRGLRARSAGAAARCVPARVRRGDRARRPIQLASIRAPTQITFGQRDMVTSTRFADPLKGGISGSELVVFENCAHAPIYENIAGFNERTLDFLKRHSG